MSDSKGAAIQQILTDFWAVNVHDPAHGIVLLEKGPHALEEAKQAILALLAQEVKRAKIDALTEVLVMNGYHSGDWEQSIFEEIADLVRSG